MTKNTGASDMSEILKRRIAEIIYETDDVDITAEAEEKFYEAVVDYIVRLTKECLELTKHSGRKTIQKNDVELVIRFSNIK